MRNVNRRAKPGSAEIALAEATAILAQAQIVHRGRATPRGPRCISKLRFRRA